MKKVLRLAAVLILLSTLNFKPSSVLAQGTAFTYQGQLQNSGSAVNGSYDLTFTLYNTNVTGSAIAGPVTNSATPVTNGLFTVLVDFGQGVFTGTSNWLEIAVSTNGANSFTTLAPRQPITPTPYAIYSANAGNAVTAATATTSGSATSAISAATANNFSGSLSGNVTGPQNATVVSTVGGVSAANVASGANAANAATSLNTPNTIIRRDASGNFSAGTITATTFNGAFSGNGISWQNVTGTSQQAQPNTGYIANNAALVTITLPTTPNLGDIVRVSGVGLGGWKIAQNAGQFIQATFFLPNITNWNALNVNWTQTSATTNSEWISIASSADGTKLAAVTSLIFTSTNSGVTWTLTSAPAGSWCSIASSSDGTKLVAGLFFGGIYTSTNSGVNWTLTSAPSSAPSGGWYSIASSSDGTKLAATFANGSSGGIFTSTNSGATWISNNVSNAHWNSIASSSDGTKLAVTFFNGSSGWIYTSTNGGATWTQTSAPNAYWSTIASSSDGTKLAAGLSSGGGIYTSTNSGITWTQNALPAQCSCLSIASSSDGTKLAAAYSCSCYTSTNSGITWTQNTGLTPFPEFYEPANLIASSADGTKLALATFNEGIWTDQVQFQTSTTTLGTAGYLLGGQNSAIELQFVGNGEWLLLSHEGLVSQY